MAGESKTFISPLSLQETPANAHSYGVRGLVEIGIVFGLILIAVWTPQGRFNTYICWAAAIATVAFSLRGRYQAQELGLKRPLSGALVMIGLGAVLIAFIAAIGLLLKPFGPPQALPWTRAWQYGLWSLLQQFILESFIFVRLESLLGARRAVLASAGLFALAHLPSPLLTALAFLGALFFCEMFRRYRNLYPLGLVHAGLGLTIAASLPNNILHHMRVGLGYLTYHP